jgi:hypothetical protein
MRTGLMQQLPIQAYDPVWDECDMTVMQSVGVNVLQENLVSKVYRSADIRWEDTR